MWRCYGSAMGALFALAVGCAVGDDAETAPADWWHDDGSGGASSSGGDATGGSDLTGPANTSASSSSSSGSGSSGSGSSTSSSSSSGGGSNLCDPDPNDHVCIDCAKTACCQQIEACLQDTDCSCFLNCAQANGTQLECFLQCGFPAQVLTDLLSCAGQACANECTNICTP